MFRLYFIIVQLGWKFSAIFIHLQKEKIIFLEFYKLFPENILFSDGVEKYGSDDCK